MGCGDLILVMMSVLSQFKYILLCSTAMLCITNVPGEWSSALPVRIILETFPGSHPKLFNSAFLGIEC